MNGSILDTNIIIHIMKGDAVVADAVRKIRGIYVPVIVLGELLFGAEKSHLKQSNEVSFGYKTTETVTELQRAKRLEDAAHTVRNPETPLI